MRPPPFTLPEAPVDRHEVEYYQVGGEWENPHIVHVRCVYHVKSTWAEVCPDRADERPGADFIDQWQVFADGKFSGRTNNGWTAVLSREWDTRFATFAEAQTLALSQLEGALAAYREKVTSIEGRLETMRRSDRGLTVECPTCKKLEHEVNHPPGMMFVGWGTGWMTCSTCNGSARVSPEQAKEAGVG